MNFVLAIGLVSFIVAILCAVSGVVDFAAEEFSIAKKMISHRVRMWRRGRTARKIAELDRIIARSARLQCEAEILKENLMKSPEYRAIEKIRKENLIENRY